jgi:hypothetical protein
MLRQSIVANSHLFPLSRNSCDPAPNNQADDHQELLEDELAFPKFRRGEVDALLSAYQKKYAPNQEKHIVTSTQGKPTINHPSNNYPSRQQLYRESNIKPRSNAQFRVKDLTLDEVILVLVHPDTNFFSSECMNSIACLDSDYNKLISDLNKLNGIHFSQLREPRLDYAAQTEISAERVKMLSACFLHYKGDVGLLVRYLGHEYTGLHRNVQPCLDRLKPHIDPDDYQSIERILTQGCPRSFDYEIPKWAKTRMIKRGNQKSLDDNMDLVIDTMNKEEKHSHTIPVNGYFCRFSPSCQHIPQGLNQRKGKKRLISDGSTKMQADDIVLNEMCSIDGEPPITFGQTKMKVLKHIWNTCISYPDEDILMAVADVKACF